MDRTVQLTQAIEKLSLKKDVLTAKAVEAKREYDHVKRDLTSKLDENQLIKKQLATIEEFNDSVNLLKSIFQASRFDELALFITNPIKVLGVNLFVGVVRGLGFAIGVLVVAAILGYLVKAAVGAAPFSNMIDSILSLF